jgi:trk system potassium uptake protein TrkH
MARSSSELKFYLGMILIAFATISVGLWFWGGSNGAAQSDLPDYSSLVRSMRDAAFSVVSMQTSTGYVTADFDRWPDLCRLVLVLCLFVGACAGSTGGGLKVIRFLIVAKVALTGLRRFGRPRAIYAIRVDGQTLNRDLVSATTSYVVLWLLAMLVGVLFLTLTRVDFATSISATISCLNNIGPGLADVGPTLHFGDMPQPAKLLLALWMILGRLEFYAIVTLLLPSFWRR